MTRPKVVMALNTAWNLVNFRAGLIRALINSGYDVVAVAPADEYVDRVTALGARFVHLPMDRKGTHPGRDLLLLWRFYRLLRQEKPAAYLGFTIKPNVYGSIAAHLLDVPVINNIAGLGTVFGKENWLTRLVRLVYRIALARATRVFFQNNDDQAAFLLMGLVPPHVVERLPGSGVDLARFAYRNPPQRDSVEQLRFILIARLLWDKGVGEFVEAARAVRKNHPQVEFCLLGFIDADDAAAVSRSQVDAWIAEDVITYLGVSDRIEVEIAAADCVVLPSYYREGVPRTLLEAAATGRPIITTDTSGCRDVVKDGVNGFLCRPRDVGDLADKMERIAALSPAEREEMGRQSRSKAEREFDEQIVVKRYLATLELFVGAAATKKRPAKSVNATGRLG